MSYEIIAEVAVRPDEVWTEDALLRLVGQRPTVHGRPAEILYAWLDQEDNVLVHLRVDGEPEPFTLR